MTTLSSTSAAFEAARSAHLSGDLPTAERGYAAVIAASQGRPATSVDDPVYRARWNLATILESRNVETALDTLEPSRRDGVVFPDPQLHVRRAQLGFRLFEQRAAANDLGPARPTVVANAIHYSPAPLQALEAGVRAYYDLRESLALPGVRAAIGEAEAQKYAIEAETGITHGAFARAAYAGQIQEAAVGRIMTADRDALVARLRARGKDVPDAMLGRLGITEGPLADAMAERTQALYAGAMQAGLDNTQYTMAWSQWLMRQRPGH